jgi:hypothetical protein
MPNKGKAAVIANEQEEGDKDEEEGQDQSEKDQMAQMSALIKSALDNVGKKKASKNEKGQEQNKGKKRKKKDSDSESESDSDSESDSESDDDGGNSDRRFKAIEKYIENQIQSGWNDQNAEQMHNVLEAIQLAISKKKKKAVKKLLSSLKDAVKEKDEDGAPFYDEMEKIIVKKMNKTKKIKKIMKVSSKKKAHHLNTAGAKKQQVLHSGKRCPHCSMGGAPNVCWTLHPELRPNFQDVKAAATAKAVTASSSTSVSNGGSSSSASNG